MLNPTWIQSARDLSARWSVSYCTLHRIGYIMTSRPIAGDVVKEDSVAQVFDVLCLPIGIETPTNSPLCNAGPTLSTKLPSKMPITIARRIQRASRRSSQPKLLKADTFVAEISARPPARSCSTSRSSLL